MARLPPVRCPQCQKKYRLPESFENRQVVCKRCQHQFLVHSGDVGPAKTVGGDVVSPFDSLDVDGLLSAPTSGLEKSKLNAKRRPKKTRENEKREKGAAPDPLDHRQGATNAESSKVDQRKAERKHREKIVETSDPDPGLIEQELEFAWAKKKKKQAAAVTDTVTSAGGTNSDRRGDPSEAEYDQEALAIYRAVTRQNRRRNLLWAMIAAVAVLLVGGFFAQQEYQLLGKPLSQAERDWLTERGFVLEARHIAKANGGDGDGAAVMVAVGKSFADVDQFGLTNGDQQRRSELGNASPAGGPEAGAVFAGGGRGGLASRRRRQAKAEPLPQVDFDTNVDMAALATAPLRAVQQIPFQGYTVAAFSPRGHAYVTGSRFIKGVSVDGGVFDQRSLRPSQTVTAIAATPDGRYVITGDDRGVVEAYRVDDQGRLSPSWKLRHIHRDKIIHLRPSADSRRIVVYCADGRLTIWDLEKQLIELNLSDLVPEVRLSSLRLTDDAIFIGSGDGIRKIQLGQSAVGVIGFDKNYRLMAADRSGANVVVADGKTISAIDAVSKKPQWSKTIRIAEEARIEFSPDGETAFYYDGGRDVLHFELHSGRLLQRYGDDRLKFVRRAAVSFDGEKLLTCGDSGTALVYKIKDANPVTMSKLKPPLAAARRDYPPQPSGKDDSPNVAAAVAHVTRESVWAACLTDQGFLIAAEQGRTIVYDRTTETIAYERFDLGQDRITTMTPVGNRLLMGRSSGLVEVAEIEQDGKLGPFVQVAGHIDPVKFFVPIPKTSFIASVTESGHTRVWDLLDLQSKETVYVGKPIASPVQSVVVDRRSDLLLAAGNVLVTLDYKSGDVKQKKGQVRVRNVSLLPDGKRLAFFDRGKLNLATTSRGDINLSIDLPEGAQSVSFSPNSKLAFLFAEEKVIVYRLRGGKEIFNFAIGSRSNKQTEMIFSADEKFMMPFHRGGKGSFQIFTTPSP